MSASEDAEFMRDLLGTMGPRDREWSCADEGSPRSAAAPAAPVEAPERADKGLAPTPRRRPGRLEKWLAFTA